MFTGSDSVVSGTRSKTQIWLVGQTRSELPHNVLPTTGDVIRTFFHHHKTLKKTVPESCKIVSDGLIEIWNRARIPTTYLPHIVAKLRSVVDKYGAIKKNKGRASNAQQTLEKEFTSNGNKLFDIAHRDAETLCKIIGDKLFLEDQRGCRKMILGGIDTELSAREDRAEQRRKVQEERQVKEKVRKVENASASYQSDDSDSEELDKDDDVGFEIEIPLYYHKQLSATDDCSQSCAAGKKPDFIQEMLSSQDVSSALDRINLSDRKFTILAAAIAKASKEDLNDVALSRSTVHRKRLQSRAKNDMHIREQFLSRNKPPLLVHWDGKVMLDSTNLENRHSNTDRLAVVVTGRDIDKILGIAKIPSGTGQAQANATFQLLHLWELTDDIVGMCFDTTASNTGVNSGACVLLQKLLGRNLMYFACRHHMHEVIIGEVFTVLFGPTRGPNVGLFERFSKFWVHIDRSRYKPLDDARLDSPLLQQLRDAVCLFLKQFLLHDTSYLPREDYKEMITLCLLLLGCELPTGAYHFRVPGAYHLARWMAKVIYCMKIYLFRDQFQLTASERKHLTEFCLFATHLYVNAWISCPVASDAPYNDLLLFKRIKQYTAINSTVAEAAMKKLKNHLWYIGSEMIPLSIFSDKVSGSEKMMIVERMILSGDDWSIRGFKYSAGECESLESKSLHELITSSSTASLRSLGLDVVVLSGKDPETWNDIPSFHEAAEVIRSLKVVNDAAERSVALMSTFNQSITRTESEMQRLVQIVEDNCRRIPDSSKSTLKAYTPR